MSKTEDIVRELYEARMTNKVAAVRALFHDDAVLQLPGSDPSPPTIDKAEKSPADLDAYVATLVTTWGWKSIDIQSLIVDGERAAVHYTLETVFNPTGETVTTQLCDLCEVRGGKIAAFTEFVDTAMVARLATNVESSAA